MPFLFLDKRSYTARHPASWQKQKQRLCSPYIICVSPLLLFPSSSHFLPPRFLLPDSHPLFVHISHWQAHSSPSAVISSLFFPLCVCLCVFNGSTCLLMPGESLTWRFLLMNQTPLIEHGCLCNDITHTPWPSHSPQAFIHNNLLNQLFRARDGERWVGNWERKGDGGPHFMWKQSNYRHY